MLATSEKGADQPSPAIAARAQRLRARHRQLDARLSETPAYMGDQQAALKIQKLRIKDELERMGAA